MAGEIQRAVLRGRRRRSTSDRRVGIALAVVLIGLGPLTVAGVGVADVDGMRPPHATAQHYRAAAADSEAFVAVRCYCGCEATLAHRHLLDCFITPDGRWEAHASGCGVCIAEAIDVAQLRQEGVAIDAIVREIDARFGVILSGG